MREVHLAGGLLAGGVGPVVADATNEELVRLGVPTRTASVPWPAWAALIGAARRLGVEAGEVTAVDLGGSSVKTALVRVLPDSAVELTGLSRVPVPFDQLEQPSGERLADFLARVLESTARDASRLGASVRGVAVSVACYVGHDRRCSPRGVYSNLPDLGDAGWRRRLEEQFGRSVDLAVVHDGTAAAASVPGRGGVPGAAVVMGTALGVGFPPTGLPAWRVLTVRGLPGR